MNEWLPAIINHVRDALGDGLTLIFTVLRVIIVYLFILVILHFTGKRQLGQLTPFDLITMLLLANAVQYAMLGPDVSLTGGLLAAFTLLIVNRAVAKSRWLRARLEGSPTLLVFRGRVIAEDLEREGVSRAELEAAVREHGIASLSEVETAVLEMDGTISVIPRGAAQVERLDRVRSRRKEASRR